MFAYVYTGDSSSFELQKKAFKMFTGWSFVRTFSTWYARETKAVKWKTESDVKNKSVPLCRVRKEMFTKWICSAKVSLLFRQNWAELGARWIDLTVLSSLHAWKCLESCNFSCSEASERYLLETRRILCVVFWWSGLEKDGTFQHCLAFANCVNFFRCRKFENEAVSMTAHMLNGDSETAGNVTSGGTESILMAMKAYRDRARALWPHITDPEMVSVQRIFSDSTRNRPNTTRYLYKLLQVFYHTRAPVEAGQGEHVIFISGCTHHHSPSSWKSSELFWVSHRACSCWKGFCAESVRHGKRRSKRSSIYFTCWRAVESCFESCHLFWFMWKLDILEKTTSSHHLQMLAFRQ